MRIISMGWTVTPPDVSTLISRFLQSDMTLDAFSRAFPGSPWSSDLDNLWHIEDVRLMLAEHNYPPGFTDDEARERLRELLEDRH